MKLSLERKIAFGLGAALVVLLLVTAAAWWNVARFKSTHFWVEHTREVLSQLEQVAGEVLTMQASATGFMLTASDEVLVPFDASSTRLTTSLAELQRLIADNPHQQERLKRLEPLAAAARKMMVDRIALRRTEGFDPARETRAYTATQQAVGRFSGLVREMEAEEHRLLNDRLRRVDMFSRLTVYTIVGTSALATGFVIMAAKIVRRDLRRRRETEQALQESFARVEDLYNRAPCGYHSLDGDGVFVAINDTALHWLGYMREEVVHRMKLSAILAPESQALFHERFQAVKRDGRVTDVEYTWRRKDGTEFPVLLNATAIYDADRKYVASRATVFDLTERKRVEAERERFFVLSRDLLCIVDAKGCFKRINPSWEHTLGYSSEELMSRPVLDFVHPDDLERTRAERARLAAGHEMVGFENRYLCKDGSYRWLRWNARITSDEHLVYASAHDVTDQHVAAERIHSLNADLANRAAQLEAANLELESFSYSVSHDLRAPLRHIDGFASLLAKRAHDMLDAEGRRYVATISQSAKRMGALIDDLLAFSRIGRVPLCMETFRHDALLAEVIANGRHDTDGRAINWDIARLPDVRADAAMLRQVWANLIENAVKYSSKTAAPRITIASRDDLGAGEIVFFIRDNGVGFDMAYAEKLFGVFQRLHSHTDFEGTGIGLANVRRIVARHGGRTWAEARVDEGATFYFSLPRSNSSSGSLS